MGSIMVQTKVLIKKVRYHGKYHPTNQFTIFVWLRYQNEDGVFFEPLWGMSDSGVFL